MKKMLFCLLCFALGLSVVPLFAQQTPVPTPVHDGVEVAATDGLILKGDLYRPNVIPEEGAPALLLLHQYESSRFGYVLAIPQLVEAGYIVLAVDLRGHGATGGTRDWVKAQDDTQKWLGFLRDQEGVNDDKVAIIGASIGSNLALIGCAQDEKCVTAVALSPGLDYFGVQPETFVVDGLASRSALLIAGRRDTESADAVRTLFVAAKGRVAAELFPAATHGTAFFASKRDRHDIMELILAWLDQAFGAAKTK